MFVLVPRPVSRSRAARRTQRRRTTPVARHDVVALIATNGADEYQRQATAANTRADDMTAAYTTTKADGVAVVWPNPQALRHWRHEQDTAQECWHLMGQCLAMRSRALVRAYQHRCYVEARGDDTTGDTTTGTGMLPRNLSDALDTLERDHGDDPPPGCAAFDHSPLATCAASNAPGCRVRSHVTRYAPRIDQRRTTAATTQERTSDTT